MTLFESTLIVQRLVIRRSSLIAYDEKFHMGVNIIRGENSSGKSTILNFIFYGLGGDLVERRILAVAKVGTVGGPFAGARRAALRVDSMR